MRSRRLATRALLAAASAFLAVFLTSRVAETWFFDRVYYRKSLAHGYALDFARENHLDRLELAGDRGRDLLRLYRATNLLERYRRPAAAPPPRDPEYTIVVFGDSLCWGQGLRDHQRWPALLEAHLDEARPTRVVSLCEQGDQLLDHLVKYEVSLGVWAADLHVFGLVSDDCSFRPGRVARPPGLLEPLRRCVDALGRERRRWRSAEAAAAWREFHTCCCVLENVFPRLPREQALYFDYGPAFHNEGRVEEELVTPFREAGFPVATLVPDPPGAAGGFSKRYYVSPMELHPSAWANRRFARELAALVAERPGFVE